MVASTSVPALSAPDSTAAFLREGYDFVGRRCEALGTDRFRTRLMLRPVTCLKGPEAAQVFYAPGRMTRRGAMPASVVALLQDKGSVQTLDGPAHEVRKALFLDMMTEARLHEARAIFAEEWDAAARSWQGCTIVLKDAVDGVMTRTALRWCGIEPLAEDVAARAGELAAMYGAAGSVGPAHLRARWLRARSERWARRLIAATRDTGAGGARSVVGRIARHRDAGGRPLSEAAAAVELLNVLRPIVAVGRYILFLAHALHVHGRAAGQVADDDAGALAIAQEVRRLYPFFPVIGGRVLEPFDWRGARFEAGEWLILDLYGTNRDPAAWPEPEAFRPDRHVGPPVPEGALIPQGGGDVLTGHRCPGEALTLAVMTEAVQRLRATDYTVPDQDLSIPHNAFPPCPGEGMRISVAPSRPGARC